jgi:predicted secreted hydrolase
MGLEMTAVAAALGEAWSEAAEVEAVSDGPLAFPRDHGVHLQAPAEVWSVSAVLNEGAAAVSTLRLTLVRLALVGSGSEGDAVGGEGVSAGQRASAFAADTLFAGELSLSADGGGPSVRAERVSRAALGLAGAETGEDGGERVWLEHWELVREEGPRVRLRALGDDLELALTLSPRKAPVSLDETVFGGAPADSDAALHGYSEPRLEVSGRVTVAGESRALHGVGWLEHAWGSLGEAVGGGRGQLVANRFRLQLDDGVDLSCLHLRRRGGGGTPIPSCALISVDGDVVALGRRDLSLTADAARWMSALGVEYPLRWRLVIPGRDLELEIAPLLDEPGGALRTLALGGDGPGWSGAVRVSGWRGPDAIGGRGYMDLSGYRDAGAGT